MTQSLSKIGVQFVADMSDMVSKMSGMSAYTKKWAKETAAMTNIGGPSGAEQLGRVDVAKGMSVSGAVQRKEFEQLKEQSERLAEIQNEENRKSHEYRMVLIANQRNAEEQQIRDLAILRQDIETRSVQTISDEMAKAKQISDSESLKHHEYKMALIANEKNQEEQQARDLAALKRDILSRSAEAEITQRQAVLAVETEIHTHKMALLSNQRNEEEQQARDLSALKRDIELRYAEMVRIEAQKTAEEAASIQIKLHEYKMAILVNERNQEEQQARDLAALKHDIISRAEDQRLQRRKAGEEEAARYDAQVSAALAAERDNIYNAQKSKERDLNARLAAEEIQAVDNLVNEERIRALELANFKKRLQEEADKEITNQQENALDRELRIARLKAEAQQAVVGVQDPYEEDRRAREKAKADRIAEDTEKANKAERDRQAALNLSNKMQEEANNLVMRARTATERYNEEIARLNSLNTHKNVLTGRSFLSDQDYLRLKTRLIIETIREQQATASLIATQQTATNAFGGVTGAMTQLSFAAEDFIQVMAMGGGFNMALMSASNNLTMVARAVIPTTAAFAAFASFTIPLVLVGLGGLIRYLSQAKDESERLRHELDLIRNTNAEDFDLGLRSRQRNFEQMLKDMQASAQAEQQIQDLKAKQIDLEEELAVKRRNAMREISAQAGSIEQGIRAIKEQYMYARAAVESHEEIIRLIERENQAIQQYSNAREKLMSTQINNAEEAGRALAQFMRDVEGIPGIDTSNISDIMADLESGTLSSFEAIRQALEEISQIEQNRKDLQERINELREEEKQRQAGELKAEQHRLEAKREELLMLMKMTEEQKKMYDLRQRQQEFVGFDPQAAGVGFGFAGVAGAAANAAMQQQADQLGLQFLLAEQARLQKEMIDAVQQPPVAGKMEENAFQAQADAMKQVMEAATRKTDTKQEAMVRHLADISAAIKNGGVIVNVIP